MTKTVQARQAVADLVEHILTRCLGHFPLDINAQIRLEADVYYAQTFCRRARIPYMRAVERELERRRPTQK